MSHANIQEIKKEREDRMSAALKNNSVFWAFSEKQFEENKTPLAEGEKYVSIGGGGYMPKGKVQSFLAETESINKWYEQAVTKAGFEDDEILYELYNHECYYTGDIQVVVDMFEGRYDRDRIARVFYANSANE
jgi:hypothetical protein